MSVSFILVEGGAWDTPWYEESPVTTGLILVST